jgi:hypothetical protein
VAGQRGYDYADIAVALNQTANLKIPSEKRTHENCGFSNCLPKSKANQGANSNH